MKKKLETSIDLQKKMTSNKHLSFFIVPTFKKDIMKLKIGIDKNGKTSKEKSKGLIVLIIVLILIILGLTAYILYDKNIIFNNAKETVEKEKNTTTTDTYNLYTKINITDKINLFKLILI